MTVELFKKALGDCKRADVSKCQSRTPYEIVQNSTFCVFDEKNEEPIRIVTGNDEYQLIVRNHNREKICVVKTDKCLFADDHKKCDCIIFNKNTIYLVEIKSSSPGAKSSKRQRAIIQLGDTIKLLLDNNIDLLKYQTKAIICFKEGKTRPTQPSLNTQRAVFFNEYKISLEEGNEIIF